LRKREVAAPKEPVIKANRESTPPTILKSP